METKEDLTNRALQLIAYLRSLQRLRSPGNLDSFDTNGLFPARWPDHPAVSFDPDELAVTIERVEAPKPLSIPSSFATKVEHGPDLLDEPTFVEIDRDDEQEAADPAREKFNSWIASSWTEWRDEAEKALQIREAYHRLYDLRLEVERDAATHEFVWTHAVLVGAKGPRPIRYPLLVTPVEVKFNSATAAIEVSAAGEQQLEIDELDGIVDGFDILKVIAEDFIDEEIGLSENEAIARVCAALPDAVRVEEAERLPAPNENHAVVGIDCLMKRTRPVRYEAFYKALEEQVKDGWLPDAWAAVLSDEPSEAVLDSEMTGSSSWSELDTRILSPLPLNAKQEEVVSRISQKAGVTVQGPPGTGKSYTIAAITSHFLAHGLRVLVCSEKAHPLRVIRDKMPESLRELCVAVLGDDAAATRQLEASVGQIVAQVGDIDPSKERKRIQELDSKLDEVRRSLSRERALELKIRSAEQTRQTIAGRELGLAEAAREVSSRKATDGWITDSIGVEQALPFGEADCEELVRLGSKLSWADRNAHGRQLDTVDGFATGSELRSLWDTMERTDAELATVASLVDLNKLDSASAEDLIGLRQEVDTHRSLVEWATTTSWAPVYESVCKSPEQARYWQETVNRLNEEALAASSLSLRLAPHSLTVPGSLDGVADLDGLIADLHGRLGLGKGLPKLGGKQLKALAAACLVDGKQITNVAEVEVVQAHRELLAKRRRISEVLFSELGRLGIETASDRPETAVIENYAVALERLLALPSETGRLTEQAASLVGVKPNLDSVQAVDEFRGALAPAMAYFEQARTQEQLTAIDALLGSASPEMHPAAIQLRSAFRNREAGDWDAALEELLRLEHAEPELEQFAGLVSQLERFAPQLADLIRLDPPRFTAIELATAWEFARTQTWVLQMIDIGDLAEVSARIEEIHEQERSLLEDLVKRRAWLGMAERMSDAQRSALTSYAQAIRRVGKGTGKHAARHRNTARSSMTAAQGAVPVWVMSIPTAIDSFRAGEDPFDVVIVDEASQAGVDAMSVIGLGRRVIVVGDDQQISPTSMVDQEEAARLLGLHLTDVPDAAGFDIRTSLYDAAQRRFPGVVQLHEHFRCLPEIIAFSNDLSYDGRVVALRERHENPDWEPVRAVRVDGGYRDGMVNPPEVEKVVELVKEICDDPKFGQEGGYKPAASIGVVTMIGTDQAKAIQSALIEEVGELELERRSIRVGSAYDFQGDERDVIIIATVDAMKEDGRPSGAAATKYEQRQRFNVAASRARDQMIVTYSVDPGLFNEQDLRGRLIRYALEPARISAASADLRSSCDSQFERDVLERLLKTNLRIDGQHPVGGYRIDFTATDVHGRRVAIECDGDSYHGIEQLKDDMDRQRVLERMGWRFVRLRASAFYWNDEAWDRVIEQMKVHGLEFEVSA